MRVLLAGVELGPLGKRAVQRRAFAFDEVAVRPGECIAIEGRLCHQLVIVADGVLSARGHDWSRELRAGEAFGWTAMQTRGVNEATLIALTEARLLVMSHAQFGSIAALEPERSALRFWALPSSRRALPHRRHLERA